MTFKVLRRENRNGIFLWEFYGQYWEFYHQNLITWYWVGFKRHWAVCAKVSKHIAESLSHYLSDLYLHLFTFMLAASIHPGKRKKASLQPWTVGLPLQLWAQSRLLCGGEQKAYANSGFYKSRKKQWIDAKQVKYEYNRKPEQNRITKPKTKEMWKMEWVIFCKAFFSVKVRL